MTGKWQFYDHFQLVFCQLYQDLSQNWGSNGHFEMLNGSKSNLVQKLWPNYKNAKNKSSANSLKFETDKRTFYNHFWSFFCQLSEHLSQNWDSDGHFEVLYESKNQLVQKLWHKMRKGRKLKWVFFNKITTKRKWKYLLFVS